MALSANIIIEVESGGSDANNAGMFDPSQTAGMLTDGAATSANTSAPVFSSASYNFVAGDVNAWLYIASGTNWIPGWYQIASVAANKATLSAAAGAGVLKGYPQIPTTATGCATTASPTTATWTIDYSQQTGTGRSYTDLASAGAGLTVSSAAFPFGKQMVGNGLVITAGTNFTAGRYIIASVAGTTATVQGAGNITSGVGASGVGGMGGALASPGQAAASKVAGNDVFVKSGTYTMTTSTAGAAGPVVDSTGGVGATNITRWEGYGSVRGDKGTKPIISAGAVTTITLVNTSGAFLAVDNITIDGNAGAATTGINQGGARTGYVRLKVQNTKTLGYNCNGGNFTGARLEATGCAGTAAFQLTGGGSFVNSEAYANTTIGFQTQGSNDVINCIASSNTGASSDGFQIVGLNAVVKNCVSYGNGRHGFNIEGNGYQYVENCIAETNSGWGFTDTNGNTQCHEFYNCAAYNNTSGNFDTTNLTGVNIGFITGTSSFFVSATTGNFALNNTASAGAALRAAGFPGTMPRGTSVGTLDIGAIQHADPAGGTGTGFFIQ